MNPTEMAVFWQSSSLMPKNSPHFTQYRLQSSSLYEMKSTLRSQAMDQLVQTLRISEAEASRFPDKRHMKVVSPTHRPPLPPTKYSWYSFVIGWVDDPRFIGRPEGFRQWKTPMTPSRDLPACTAVRRTTAPTLAPSRCEDRGLIPTQSRHMGSGTGRCLNTSVSPPPPKSVSIHKCSTLIFHSSNNEAK